MLAARLGALERPSRSGAASQSPAAVIGVSLPCCTQCHRGQLTSSSTIFTGHYWPSTPVRFMQVEYIHVVHADRLVPTFQQYQRPRRCCRVQPGEANAGYRHMRVGFSFAQTRPEISLRRTVAVLHCRIEVVDAEPPAPARQRIQPDRPARLAPSARQPRSQKRNTCREPHAGATEIAHLHRASSCWPRYLVYCVISF